MTRAFSLGAGDQIRTGDPHLGKVILETRQHRGPGRMQTFPLVRCLIVDLNLGRSWSSFVSLTGAE